MADDEEMDVEKDSKEGPRFVVKKWCGAPVLRWLLVVAAAARPEAWRLSACRSPGQERRDVLVLGHLHRCARLPPPIRCCSSACIPIVRAARTRARAALAPRSPSRLRPEGPTPEPACPPRPRLTPRATPCVGALEGAFDLAKGRERRAEGRSGDGVARAGWASAQVPGNTHFVRKKCRSNIPCLRAMS